MQPSPIKSAEPLETVTLIPMGAARLRIAAFPVIGDGPDAHEWPKPVEPDRRTTASHCWDSDSVKATCDAMLPRSSNDQSIPRMTWWDHRGSEEWLRYDFPEPRKVSRTEVYWFDDTGRGQCRLPQAWSLEYLDGETWKPVRGSGTFGTEPDKFNRVDFEPVTAPAVRLKVQLQPEFSGGVLEWRVE